MRSVVGIDEVGRGSWAGPLVAGAVILSEPITGLRDSKKLSKKQREKLDIKIREKAIAIGLGWVEPNVIDEIGLQAAVKLAMQRAVAEISVDYNEIIIDGSINFLNEDVRSRAIVKADDSVPAVSAASIVAKVARDNYMAEMAKAHPNYGFELHVGYGTKLHTEMLKLYGACELHRMSFKPLKAFV